MFDQRQIAEFKEAFTFIDQNADGYIDRQDLKEIFTSLGHLPSEEELDEMLSDVPNGVPGLNFTLFLTMMGDRMQGIDSEGELLQAFETLNPLRTGKISPELLREYLTSMGDKFTEEEFEVMIRGVDLDDANQLNYRQFVKTLTNAHLEDDIDFK